MRGGVPVECLPDLFNQTFGFEKKANTQNIKKKAEDGNLRLKYRVDSPKYKRMVQLLHISLTSYAQK
jgi:hypothetical protein